MNCICLSTSYIRISENHLTFSSVSSMDMNFDGWKRWDFSGYWELPFAKFFSNYISALHFFNFYLELYFELYVYLWKSVVNTLFVLAYLFIIYVNLYSQ